MAAARRSLGPDACLEQADALTMDWGSRRFDVVLGNPPFLSQMATATTRGGASRHGGGPYADVAAEFLALAVRLARPDGGRVGLVLPQSVLASRDAAAVRGAVDRTATLRWSWWSHRRPFDAQVHVCALVWERHGDPVDADPAPTWSHVVTGALAVPPLPPLDAAGALGERARLTANFRDQYYGLVPAVEDGGEGPPLVTSGLLDPGRCEWGRRPVRFAGRRMTRPTVHLDRLAPAMRRWAAGLLVPKVLVANQTRVVEAAVDAEGAWLPGVPVITARPLPGTDPWAVAAVLTSPVASAWAWHRAAGTGLSARAVRLGPRWLGELPWPAGPLGDAVAALPRATSPPAAQRSRPPTASGRRAPACTPGGRPPCPNEPRRPPRDHQSSPVRCSQAMEAVRSSAVLGPVGRTMTPSSSSGVRTAPSAVRTNVGPRHRCQPTRS